MNRKDLCNIERAACDFANSFHDKKTDYVGWIRTKFLYKKGWREGIKEKESRTFNLKNRVG